MPMTSESTQYSVLSPPTIAESRAPGLRVDRRHDIPILLAARGLQKSYRKGKLVVPVLKGVDFTIRSGEFVAVAGQSGCGKSTLLHLLGTLDSPDAGEIQFEGQR